MTDAADDRPSGRAALPDFERALAELESIVERLEGGDLSLEESLRCFERGIVLARTCQQALREAEQKVQILLEGEDSPRPFQDSPDG